MLDDSLLLHNIWVTLTEDPSATQPLENLSHEGVNCLELGHDGLLCQNNRVFVSNIGNLWLWVLKSRHDHPLAGHFSLTKTLELLHWDFTWPRLQEFVTDYVKTCNVCLRNKPCHHRPYGLLNQLPIPLCPWDSISMDFIEQLPESNSHTNILVTIDWLTKQVIFIPTSRMLSSPRLASLFISHVFAKHGIPSHVTSNCGAEFIS